MITLNVARVEDALFKSGIDIAHANYFISDSQGAVPTMRWIKQVFAPAFRKFMEALNAQGYKVETWDCDDFARAAAFYAAWLWKQTPGSDGACLLFGEFWFTTRRGVKHAINCFAVRAGTDYELAFFEPQTQEVVELNAEEVESCAFLRF